MLQRGPGTGRREAAGAGRAGYPVRDEHRRPRGRGDTQPGRSSSVRNVVTPPGSGLWAGKPTVRRAQLLGGYRMTEKRTPVAERRQETRDRLASPLRLVVTG